MARFKIIANGQSRLYDILEDALTAGSAPGNAIRIAQPGVAEVHVRVWRDRDGVWLSPVAGAPLSIDGEPVAQHRLRHGDSVSLAPDVRLEFLDPRAASPDARSAPSNKRAADRPAAAEIPAKAAGRVADRPAAPAAARASSQPAIGPPVQPAGARAAPPPTPRAADLVVPSVTREVKQRRAAQAAREGRRRPVPASPPRWHLFSGLILLSAAVIWILLRVLAGSVGGQSAADQLALAETQLVRGDPQAALRTAKAAAARAEGDIELQHKIAAFEARIEQINRAAADSALLDNARQAFSNLEAFERIYLAPAPTARPACREFVRIADRWRTEYAEVCERHPESSGLVAEVAAMRARYVAAAELERPDDVEDVLFAARRATRLRRPRYKDAVQLLDSFIAGAGDPAAVERARAYRSELVEAGRSWLDQRVEQLQREFERGRADAVLSEIDLLLSDTVLDEWKPALEARARAWRQSTGR